MAKKIKKTTKISPIFVKIKLSAISSISVVQKRLSTKNEWKYVNYVDGDGKKLV